MQLPEDSQNRESKGYAISIVHQNVPKLLPGVGNTVGISNSVVIKKGLRTNLKPLFINLVAGAGFEPATFGL